MDTAEYNRRADAWDAAYERGEFDSPAAASPQVRTAPPPPPKATATETFNRVKAELMAKGKTEAQAIRQIAVELPQVHRGYLAEHNAEHRHQRDLERAQAARDRDRRNPPAASRPMTQDELAERDWQELQRRYGPTRPAA